MPRDRDQFKSRELTETERELLRRQVELYHTQTHFPEAARRNTLFVVACNHVQRQLVEVETEYGIWGLEVCADCGEKVAGPECPHVRSTWHLDGAILICDNCGIDGT